LHWKILDLLNGKIKTETVRRETTLSHEYWSENLVTRVYLEMIQMTTKTVNRRYNCHFWVKLGHGEFIPEIN